MSEHDLIERLLNPMWVHMRSGEPYLDDEATLADLKEAAATIARLSEALAEAEKKGAEARAKALEDAIEAIRAAAVTTTLSGDDAASFCNGADWMEGEAIKAIRDLSQGGQHG